MNRQWGCVWIHVAFTHSVFELKLSLNTGRDVVSWGCVVTHTVETPMKHYIKNFILHFMQPVLSSLLYYRLIRDFFYVSGSQLEH